MSETLSLLDAFLRWTDPALLEAIWEQERRLGPNRLGKFYADNLSWCRLIPIEEADQAIHQLAQQPGFVVPLVMPAGSPRLAEAWKAAERHFRAWLALHATITGVQTKPQLLEERRPIPGAWASDAQIDFHASALTIGDKRFGGVMVSEAPTGLSAQTPISGLAQRGRITPENVHTLEDSELLQSFEEDRRRSMRDHGRKLLMSGRPTFERYLLNMMRERAARGVLRDSVSAEAHELAVWIAKVVPSHQVPTPEAIENMIRVKYWQLRARSTTTTP